MISRLWAKCIFLFLFLLVIGSQIVFAFSLSCRNNTIVDIVAGHQSVLTCYSKDVTEWRIVTSKINSSHVMALWDETKNEFNVVTNLNGAFIIKNVSDRDSPLTINPENITKASQSSLILNGTISCGYESCGLNYVDPAEGVSCTAMVSSWNVTVSCNITKAYSSRRIYTCQLFKEECSSTNDSLQRINMVTSPTNDSVGRNEVKISGDCRFSSTQLPERNGSYAYYVYVSSSGRNHSVQFPAYNQTWVRVDWPSSPLVTCQPQPYVLENTNVFCTCSTSSLGNPAGSLLWVIDGERNSDGKSSGDIRGDKPQYLYYNRTLTKTDHNKTLLKCDVRWGSQTIGGQTYAPHVGSGPRNLRLYLNQSQKNQTVNEDEEVQMSCSSDGNPLPHMTLLNIENGTMIDTGLSPVIANVRVRCEDGGFYQCSAENYFSTENSTSLFLEVRCKPRPLSSNIVISLKNRQFDVISYPKPVNFTMWYLGNTSNATTDFPESNTSAKPIVCSHRPKHRYQFSCTLTFNDSAADMAPGFYRLHVVNQVGEGCFTVEVQNDVTSDDNSEADDNNGRATKPAVVGGVAALGIVVAIIVFAIVIVIVRRKRKAPSQMNRLAARADIVRLGPRDGDHSSRAEVETEMETAMGPHTSLSLGHDDSADWREMRDSLPKPKNQLPASDPECTYANIGTMDGATTATDEAVDRKTGKEKGHKKDWKAVFSKTGRQDQDTVPLRDSEFLAYSDSQEVTAVDREPVEYSNVNATAAAAGPGSDESEIGKWKRQESLVYAITDFDPGASSKPKPVRERTEYTEVTFVNGVPCLCD